MQTIGNAHPGGGPTLGERIGSVLFRLLLAVVIWAALGLCIGTLIDLVHPQPTTEVEEVRLRAP
ncbi:MAG: hypothetical protein R3C15_03835 [Thermoleophilia bacterium]